MNILWDFDGTLFDTYPAYTIMLSEILGDSVEKQEIYKNLKYHTLMQFSIIIFHASRKKRLKF